MQIINGTTTTYVSFSDDFTSATLTRARGIVYTVIIPKDKFTMESLNRLTSLDNDSFIGLATIQRRLRD